MNGPISPRSPPAPALGERYARWGFGYQDKAATERLLDALRADMSRSDPLFEGVRLADLHAGRVDDFVMVWRDRVEGNSIKWSASEDSFNWADLVGAQGLLGTLVEGRRALERSWPRRKVLVRLQSNRPPATTSTASSLVSALALSDFLAQSWPHGPRSTDAASTTSAWTQIGLHAGLEREELAVFAAHCHLDLGHPQPPNAVGTSEDARQYRKQFDLLHRTIATWLTNNPKGELISADHLMGAIGMGSRRAPLVQHFPAPGLPYQQATASAGKLRRMIEETAGGYLAVVGAAGIGKSTLVQDVLRDFPLTVPYFAYLPEGLGNARDRGEALTFYQDIVARLDRLDTSRRGLGIQELAEGRAALRRHMASAHDRYTQAGTKTILLVDGLDHVQREVGLQHSVLLELPPPAEVPDGFLIVLSGQPQAFLAAGIGPHVSSALRPTSARSLTLEGLARSEAFALVSAARSASSEELKNEIADESSGNPLILTYLINAVNPASGLREAPIARYAGDIDAYYRASLFVSLEGQATRDALALLSRAAPTLPSNWLLNWPERASLESVFAHELASFVRNEDGVVQFIHNSLVAFLREETRSRIPGLDPEIAERHLYSTLAERCAEQGCNSAIGRARISFLLRAKRHQDFLATLTDSGYVRGWRTMFRMLRFGRLFWPALQRLGP